MEAHEAGSSCDLVNFEADFASTLSWGAMVGFDLRGLF